MSGKSTPVTRLAALLRVHPRTVKRWIAEGLVTRNDDGTLSREDVAALLDTRKIPA